jgi:hypothetical protein
MDPRRRAISLAGLSMGLALSASAQDVQERTIRFYDEAIAKLYADELARIHKG